MPFFTKNKRSFRSLSLLLILVWIVQLASAASESIGKLGGGLDELESNTIDSFSGTTTISTNTSTTSSNSDLLARYLDEDTENNGNGKNTTNTQEKGHKRINVNSQAILLICTSVCFVIFFFCCLRAVVSVRYETVSDGPGTTSSTEAIREAIIANLSVFQRRAILEILFHDDQKFADTHSDAQMKGGKHAVVMLGDGSYHGQDGNNNNGNYNFDNTNAKSKSNSYSYSNTNSSKDTESDTEKQCSNLMVTPPRKKKKHLSDDEESPPMTPSTHHMSPPSPDSSQQMLSLGNIPSTCSPVASLLMLTLQKDPLSNLSDGDHFQDNVTGNCNANVGTGAIQMISLQPRPQYRLNAKSSGTDYDADMAIQLSHPLSTDGVEKQEITAQVSTANANAKSDLNYQEAASIHMEDKGDEGDAKGDKGGMKEEDLDESNLCSICLDTYEEQDKIIISKHCKHYFHRDCIIQWLEYQKSDYKCPECRNEMITTDELREAATQVVGDAVMKETIKPQFGIGRVMREYGAPSLHSSPGSNPWVRDYEWGAPAPLPSLSTSTSQSQSVPVSPAAQNTPPRRRTYSDESPVFVPDFQ